MAGLTYEEARDYILDKFKVAWDANSPAVNGGAVPAVEYQNVQPSKAPLADGNKAWARITVKHSSSEQRSMGTPGNRVFTRRGVVTVQVFVPAGKQGLVLADRLGKVAADAFEGEETSTGNVWFRNVAYREIGVDNGWFQVNALAEFEYDAVK
jgi:cyanophycinase-like exopeptidase